MQKTYKIKLEGTTAYIEKYEDGCTITCIISSEDCIPYVIKSEIGQGYKNIGDIVINKKYIKDEISKLENKLNLYKKYLEKIENEEK